MRQWPLSILLSACSDYAINGEKPAPSSQAVDTAAPTADTGDTSDPADSADTGSNGTIDDTAPTCERTWPDRAVSIDASCPDRPVADWALTELWRYDRADMESVTTHAGRFSDDDGDGVITPADGMGPWVSPYTLYTYGDGHVLLDAAGAEERVDTSYAGTYRTYARTADFDPARLGAEVGVHECIYQDELYWSVGDEGSQYARATTSDGNPRTPDGMGIPWFVDLDLDGLPEVLVGDVAFRAVDGAWFAALSDASPGAWTVAGDLDRDGFPEIVSLAAAGGVGIWEAGGSYPTVCASSIPVEQHAMFAIANLDADDDAEVLAAGEHLLALCDADGTLLAETTTDSYSGSVIGVGELDGDPEPEIVLDYNGVVDGAFTAGIVVYDEALQELWRVEIPEYGWNPFSLADLDGDGLHEILVREADDLVILGPTGVTLATIATGYGNNSWMNVPLVVDVDGDDLAEIVVSGSWPAVQVFENAAGGWLVEGAEVASPGVGHHPGIVNVDGTVPAESAWWLEANVWQGHAAPAGGRELPNLTAAIEAVCSDDCAGDVFVTVYVTNSGTADVLEPVPVSLTRIDSGAVVAEGRLDAPLPAGMSRALELTVSIADASAGLAATLDGAGIILECLEGDNDANWVGVVCP